MKEKTSALHSEYIIDGTREELTPAQMLDSCMIDTAVKSDGMLPLDHDKGKPGCPYDAIADETIDPTPGTYSYDNSKLDKYLQETLGAIDLPRNCPISFPEQYTRYKIAKALIDAIWMGGHFKLGDIFLSADWQWDSKPLGNMAAFYASASSASEYIDNLGVRLSSYSFSEKKDSALMSFKVGVKPHQKSSEDDESEDLLMRLPFETEHPRMGKERACPEIFKDDESSWLIYIPFDSADPLMGGSLLAERLNASGNIAPDIIDSDYTIDCYEVVRELVEDRILCAGATVGDGGLLTALDRMRCPGFGAEIDIDNLLKAYGADRVHCLFSEIPGAIIQIEDKDYDYVDAELLLQDIAYYPLGHPKKGANGIRISTGGTSGISGILQSLLGSQTSEGED
jgi:hypothetical protein